MKVTKYFENKSEQYRQWNSKYVVTSTTIQVGRSFLLESGSGCMCSFGFVKESNRRGGRGGGGRNPSLNAEIEHACAQSPAKC